MSKLTFDAWVTKKFDLEHPSEPQVRTPTDYSEQWWKMIEPFLINYTDVYKNKCQSAFIEGIGEEPSSFTPIKKKKDIETFVKNWLKMMASVITDECPDPSPIMNGRKMTSVGMTFTCDFTRSGGGARIEIADARCKSPSWCSITFRKDPPNGKTR